ncbi:MAG: 3-hydroxyisobutyrate dehydrogenase [Neorhizobium sp.]|nr:3-hydroxyisobutyrate dehydrogenase [Neorhizobium sp.]
MARIAFIGLGNMGGPMAANLVKAGHHVCGFDLSVASVAAAEDGGVTAARTLADAVNGGEGMHGGHPGGHGGGRADCVITMLPKGEHVLSVWHALAALLSEGASEDMLLIDCSTIDVQSAREAHGLADAMGCLSLDAPVSGGTVGASAGTLTFMAGGSSAAFDKGEPILAAMGKRIVHCGEAGAGQAAKICNNMILGISMIGVAEAFALGEKLGLSHQALFDVASTSSGQCWALTTNCPVPGPVPTSPANRDYRPGFAASLMLKDLNLSQEAAGQSGAATPLGRHASELYAAFEKAGHGAEDFSAIINLLRERAG